MSIETVRETVPHEKMIVTLSGGGFIKRIPAAIYRTQHRRGKDFKGMLVQEADAAKFLVEADTDDTLFFFTNMGKVFSFKTHEIFLDNLRSAKGQALVDFIHIVEGERVTAVLPVTYFNHGQFFLMATGKGEVKKSPLNLYNVIRSGGIIAMDLESDDQLVSACLATDTDDVVMITEQGQSIRFNVKNLRASSRTSGGVRGIKLAEGDKLVSMTLATTGSFLLVITVKGYGKLTEIEEYRPQNRGGSGIKTLKIAEKTGRVAAARLVRQTEYLMLVSQQGMVISTPLNNEDGKGIPNLGRNCQGVIIVKMDRGDAIAAVSSWV